MSASLVALGWGPILRWRAAFRTRPIAAALVLAFTLGPGFSACAIDPPPSARTFDSLTVAGTTYTQVTIVDISKRHVSFRSAQGFAMVRMADLDSAIQTRLASGSPEVSSVATEARPVATAPHKARRPLKVQARDDTESEPDEDCDDDHDVGTGPPIQWTTRNIVGVGVLGLGALAIAVGHIWFICAGFHTSVIWGVVLLFGSIVADVMFCVGHWEAARRPTCVQMAGIALIVGGLKIFAR